MSDDEARARARVGTVLSGKYRLDEVIGDGGMASVFAATHLRNGNRVAVKILHRELTIEPDLRARFLREGYAANSVGHPGTVRILDDDKAEDGSIFLVMELLEGETLDARWERSHHKLGVSEVVTLMRDLLDVLAAAHAKGIVHRDIKPENLFLTREGRVKVLDFGIARLHQASSRATGSGAVFGTPAFMPPEQALGRTDEVDALSDVWAVGATAFTLLSGHFVHDGATAAEVQVRAATLRAPPLAEVAPQVPAPIARVIDRALAFSRDERWPSANAMLDALTQARDGTLPEAPDQGETEANDYTKVAPPAPPKAPRGGAEPSEVPPGSPHDRPGHAGLSTVAGVTSSSETGRARSRQRRVLLGAVALGLLATLGGIVATRASRDERPAPTPSARATDSQRAATSTPAPPAGNPEHVSVPAVAESAAMPWVPVEALPKATAPAPAATAPRAPANPPSRAPASAAPAPPRPPPPATTTPVPKHDPLAP